MNRILLGIPTFENVTTETFKSVYDLDIPDDVTVNLEFIKGYDCARARNTIAKKAIDEGYDYVFMVDSDVILKRDTLKILYAQNENIIMGYYPRKYEPNKIEIFRPDDRGYPAEARYSLDDVKLISADKFKIHGGGFGCVLIKTKIFEKLRYPYFSFVNYSNGVDVLSEDLYFCSSARGAGFDIYAATHAGCGHVGKNVIRI